jgi:hypothetical protein
MECPRCQHDYDEHTPLYPITDLVPRGSDGSREDSPGAKLAKLERASEEASVPLAETVPLLALVLSLPPSDRHS